MAEPSKGQEALSMKHATVATSHNPSHAGASGWCHGTYAYHGGRSQAHLVSPKSGQGASTPSRFPPPRFGSRELVNFPTCIARQGIRASCAAAQRCPLSRLMGLPDGVAASIEVARLAQAELLGHAVIIEDFTEV